MRDSGAAEHLSTAESKLLQHAASGAELVLHVDSTSVDLADMESWGDAWTLRATLIRELLVNPGADVHTRGVRVRGARIEGQLDFESAVLLRPLHLTDCFLDGRDADGVSVLLDFASAQRVSLIRCQLSSISATASTLHRGIDLTRSCLRGALSLDGATVSGEVTCSAVQILGSDAEGHAVNATELTALGVKFDDSFIAGGEIRLANARLSGELCLRSARLSGTGLTGASLVARDMTAASITLAGGFEATGYIDVSGTKIENELNLRGAALQGKDSDGDSLVADFLAAGSVYLDRGFSSAGAIRLHGAHLRGPLVCGGANLAGTDQGGNALVADGLVADDVFLNDKLLAAGAIRLDYAKLSGAIVCTSARIQGADGSGAALLAVGVSATNLLLDGGFSAAGAVLLTRTRLSGGVYGFGAQLDSGKDRGTILDADELTAATVDLRGCKLMGEVRLRGASIGGTLYMTDAAISNPGRIALMLNNAFFLGGTDLDRLVVTGQVSAIGMHARGQFSMSGAKIDNPGDSAFCLDGARIEGTVFLDRVTCSGGVSGTQAYIADSLNLTDTRLSRPFGSALLLDRVRVDGNIDCGRLVATGEVRTLGAAVTGIFNLRGAQLRNRSGASLNGERMHVGALFFDDESKATGRINLVSAHIGNLVTGKRCPPGPLVARGWQVQDMHGVIRDNREVAATWLGTATPFAAQPWHELASVFERNGQTRDSRYLRVRAAREATARAARWSRPLRWTYGVLVGYGYRPLRAGGWLLATVFAAWLLCSLNEASFRPSNVGVLQIALDTAESSAAGSLRGGEEPPLRASNLSGATDCAAFQGRYPCYRPIIYGLESVLPSVVISGQHMFWQPAPSWVAYSLTVVKLFGWLLTALLLAGLTGLLRRA